MDFKNFLNMIDSMKSSKKKISESIELTKKKSLQEFIDQVKSSTVDLKSNQLNEENINDLEDEHEDEDDKEYLKLKDGDYVRDEQDGRRGEIFKMKGDPTERRVRIEDKDDRGWYIHPSRLIKVSKNDPMIYRWFPDDDLSDEDDDDLYEADLNEVQQSIGTTTSTATAPRVGQVGQKVLVKPGSMPGAKIVPPAHMTTQTGQTVATGPADQIKKLGDLVNTGQVTLTKPGTTQPLGEEDADSKKEKTINVEPSKPTLPVDDISQENDYSLRRDPNWSRTDLDTKLIMTNPVDGRSILVANRDIGKYRLKGYIVRNEKELFIARKKKAKISESTNSEINKNLTDSDPKKRAEVFYDISTYPKISIYQIEKALRDNHADVYTAAVQHEKTTVKQLQWAFQHFLKDPWMKTIIALDPKATDDILTSAANDEDFAVRRAAVSNKNASSSLLMNAMSDDNHRVRQAAVENPKAKNIPELLNKAKNDSNWEVRNAARIVLLHDENK